MKSTFYVQVEPRWSRHRTRPDGLPDLDSIQAVALTKNRPTHGRRGNSVVVKLTLDVPDSAFYPLTPEAVIVVPEDMAALAHAIEVEATDPGQPDGAL